MGRSARELFAVGTLAVRPGHALSYLASRLTARGELARVLPGVYCAAGCEHEVSVKAAAVMASDPDAVITGCAAAALTWWPECPVREVQAYRRRPAPASGFAWSTYRPSEDLVLRKSGVSIACPALAVLDMIPVLGGRAIDEALRLHAVTLADLHRALALTPNRPGNRLRRWLIADSRDEPWSELERTVHRLLRGMKLGVVYRTNYRIELADGVVIGDVAMPELSVNLELDGFEFHSSRAAFERDRLNTARLVAAGWVVVRLTWAMVEHQPQRVEQLLRAIIETRRIQLGLGERAGRRKRRRLAA